MNIFNSEYVYFNTYVILIIDAYFLLNENMNFVYINYL